MLRVGQRNQFSKALQLTNRLFRIFLAYSVLKLLALSMGLKDRLVRQRSARMPSNDESDSTGSTLPSPGKASITGIGAKILSSLRLERSRHGQGAPRLTAGPHMHPCDGAKSVRESLSGKEGEVPPTTRTDPSRWTSLWRVTSRKPDIASQRERVSLAKGFTPAVAAGGGGSITAANVGAAVDSLSRATMFDTFVSTVPAFERTRHRVLPVVSQKFVSHLPGTVVRDDHIAFTVPPSWIATRGDYCFILSTDICVGFILATEAASASASLCDTSQLVILDHLEPMASPTFDANCNVLVVEYRGPGSGRG